MNERSTSTYIGSGKEGLLAQFRQTASQDRRVRFRISSAKAPLAGYMWTLPAGHLRDIADGRSTLNGAVPAPTLQQQLQQEYEVLQLQGR